MVSIHITYDGNKACSLTHDDSGSTIRTTAPKDIGGEGTTFSPTDLVAAALGSCVLTTIGMFAERNEIDLTGCGIHVTKEMTTEAPRRIARLAATVTLPADGVPEGFRERLEKIAHTCPVAKSLGPDVELPMAFEYR